VLLYAHLNRIVRRLGPRRLLKLGFRGR
jgi:hypothetical protein